MACRRGRPASELAELGTNLPSGRIGIGPLGGVPVRRAAEPL